FIGTSPSPLRDPDAALRSHMLGATIVLCSHTAACCRAAVDLPADQVRPSPASPPRSLAGKPQSACGKLPIHAAASPAVGSSLLAYQAATMRSGVPRYHQLASLPARALWRS